jgi:hypothetical protein
MAYVTVAQALRASRSAWASRGIAESHITKSASTPIATDFDIFLSHSYEDAEVIAGIKLMIEEDGLSVYVDWMEDSQADRSQVSPKTANILRLRMSHCRFLLYASSKTSPSSKWMPWELGYFDGMNHGQVGILPIVETANSNFAGQEYLGLYPAYQLIDFTSDGRHLGRIIGQDKGERLKTAAKRT